MLRFDVSIVFSVYFSFLAFIPLHISFPDEWNLLSLGSKPALREPVNISDLFEFFNAFSFGCLTSAQSAHHSVNRWLPADNITSNMTWTEIESQIATQHSVNEVLAGHTLWINEHMAVGHAAYDIYLIQLLRIQKIDRIILQRAGNSLCTSLYRKSCICIFRRLYACLCSSDPYMFLCD